METLTEPVPFAQLPIERIVARVGLISDTHMPERCVALPSSINDVFQDIDLLLHAGDLGELWVLEHLSAIAPVVAVHGNDETPEAQRELPYQQLVSIAGKRILLWHSHYPDEAEERASRSSSWERILTRQAERGRRAGADIVVFGHAHVPLARRYDDILLVNPGALASGGFFTHHKPRTVALLFICDDGSLFVAHVDLADPDRVFVPGIDWGAAFEEALAKFQVSIVEPDLVEDIERMKWLKYRDLEAIKGAILPLCHACWSGTKSHITRVELLREIKGNTGIAPTDKEKVMAILSAGAD